MAAPASIALEKLDGQWVMNKDISSDSDAILKLQGINWLMRKVLNTAKVTVSIKEWVDPSTGLTHVDIVNTPSSGLPSSTEVRVFNNEGIELPHPLFGKIRTRSRWAGAGDLDQIDGYLVKGFESGIDNFIHIVTEHLDYDAVTHQAWGFEEVEGNRRYSRHIVVKKGEEVLRSKLVYDYLGP